MFVGFTPFLQSKVVRVRVSGLPRGGEESEVYSHRVPESGVRSEKEIDDFTRVGQRTKFTVYVRLLQV